MKMNINRGSNSEESDSAAAPVPERMAALTRGMGLLEATSANMLEMIGIGPFITIPIILAAMGGPQAMLGWVLGAALVVCDGMVWAELGAAMPQAVAPRIDALLHDADPDVRIFTVNMLGELRHPRLATWLRQVLQQDDQVNVVAAAIEVLAEVGSNDDIAALRQAERRFESDPFVGFAAQMAVQRIEGE